MDRWKREGLLSANNGLRNQVENLLDTFERQRGRLSEMYRQLENVRVQASSPDRAVEVTVDAGGVLTDLRLSASALRGSPEKLASAIVETVQAAAQQARQQSETLAAPLAADIDDVDDLPDILPEAPSLREVRDFFREGDGPTP
ncbi:YbaB/EbfC family nucleoid-associated protein [Nocardia veterana]|uniref:YbaB/EbfC family nucleoid-associated protein n=1 Tax=Nocardia veterana TaxID=132249 RepID=A0A7X6M438_9NOCA|nr:YbaB/EbfC family nucleoid-associated protein [Nocardia veterana]NKY89429.1 YbaB/EbfC family nucleoid-associated protein [Nocardia veterana]